MQVTVGSRCVTDLAGYRYPVHGSSDQEVAVTDNPNYFCPVCMECGPWAHDRHNIDRHNRQNVAIPFSHIRMWLTQLRKALADVDIAVSFLSRREGDLPPMPPTWAEGLAARAEGAGCEWWAPCDQPAAGYRLTDDNRWMLCCRSCLYFRPEPDL